MPGSTDLGISFERVALITGGSSGIGRALALRLAASGYTVGLVARGAAALEAVAQECAASKARVVVYSTDLGADEAVGELAECIGRDLGRIDVLVHGAGELPLGGAGSGTLEEFDLSFRINARAPFLLTRLLLPLVKNSRGQIVFLNSSVANQAVRAGQTAYASAKHALRAIADGFRAEVNGDGVRVLSVYPGRTATPMQARVHEAEGKEYRPERLLQPDDVATAILAALELPRTAEVTDLALRPMLKS